jgi:hypothetical protein
MTKIKYIHCFGTSYTAGGGFEFESDYRCNKDMLLSIYGHLNEEFTQYNFSYPGQLQKLVRKNIQVINHAKQGFGDDRSIRLAYDLIQNNYFKNEQNLFIFEFSGLGRDEFFLKEINDYIVCNYNIDFDSKNNFRFKYIGSARDYHYDTKEIREKVDKYDNFFISYLENFGDLDSFRSKLERQSNMFITYLESKNINYLLITPPFIGNNLDTSKQIEFGDGIYLKKNNDFVKFINENKLTIRYETTQNILDDHAGLNANKIASMCLYNKLVLDGYIDENLIDIDWVQYDKLTL